MGKKLIITGIDKKHNLACRKALAAAEIDLNTLAKRTGISREGLRGLGYWLSGDLDIVGERLERIKLALPSWEKYHAS